MCLKILFFFNIWCGGGILQAENWRYHCTAGKQRVTRVLIGHLQTRRGRERRIEWGDHCDLLDLLVPLFKTFKWEPEPGERPRPRPRDSTEARTRRRHFQFKICLGVLPSTTKDERGFSGFWRRLLGWCSPKSKLRWNQPGAALAVLNHTSDRVTWKHPHSSILNPSESDPSLSSVYWGQKGVATCKPGKRQAIIRSRKHVVVRDKYRRWDRIKSV